MSTPFYRGYFSEVMSEIEHMVSNQDYFFRRINLYVRAPYQSSVDHWFNDNSPSNGHCKIKRSGRKTAQLSASAWKDSLAQFSEYNDFVAVQGDETVEDFVLRTIDDQQLRKRAICGIDVISIASCQSPLRRRAMCFVGVREQLDGIALHLNVRNEKWISGAHRPFSGTHLTELVEVPWHGSMAALKNNKFSQAQARCFSV